MVNQRQSKSYKEFGAENMDLELSLFRKIRAKNIGTIFELEKFQFIFKFYLNKIDDDLRINRNVSNSNMFHIFLTLIFLIPLLGVPNSFSLYYKIT